jgi:hypothetical protein
LPEDETEVLRSPAHRIGQGLGRDTDETRFPDKRRGGRATDVIDGGDGTDVVNSVSGTDTCSNVELGPC